MISHVGVHTLPFTVLCKGVCIHWTRLLDWTLTLFFDHIIIEVDSELLGNMCSAGVTQEAQLFSMLSMTIKSVAKWKHTTHACVLRVLSKILVF